MNIQSFRAASVLAIAIPLVHAQTVLNGIRYQEFPSTLPGKVLKVEKVLNASTGQIDVKILMDGQETNLNLVDLERAEEATQRAQLGTWSEWVNQALSGLGPNDRLKVAIYLKFPPISYPDKTRHTNEELLASSLAAAAVQPIASPSTIISRYGLDGFEVRGNGILAGGVTKSQLISMKADADIGAIELAKAEKNLAPELTTLSPSAYRASIPSGAGSGVKAATFENGIAQSFLSCIGVTPVAWDTSYTGVPVDLRHSEATFRCLAATAPSASLFHRRSVNYDGTNDINYLINNGIQTVSMSVARGGQTPYHSTYSEFLVMDDFAYRSPYPVFVTPAGNDGYQYEVNWQCYNAISVGDVRHTNATTYEMADCTQAKNPPYIYCQSNCNSNYGDREMPHVLVPGIPQTDTVFATTCLDGSGSLKCATSFSAAVGNGLAADIIAADTRMVSWPEKVRATMILTATNLDNGDWNTTSGDGRDGTGVVNGSDAVSFAQNHTTVTPGNTAVQKGMGAAALYATDWNTNKRYYVVAPNPLPSGKHLRAVLTWDSNPVVGGTTNALSDLDLIVQINGGTMTSASWDSNVEVVDVPWYNLTAGSTYYIDVHFGPNRIPTGSRTNYFYYAVAWEWVSDQTN